MMTSYGEFQLRRFAAAFWHWRVLEEEYARLEAGTAALARRDRFRQDFATKVGDRIYFIVDTSDLTLEGQEILTKQRNGCSSIPMWLSRSKAIDERGPRYNIALSARRATATREFLIARA